MATKKATLAVDKPHEVVLQPSVTVTRLRVIPRIVNGRIELHYEELPDDARIEHPRPARVKSCHP
jgi:hypothetical protein